MSALSAAWQAIWPGVVPLAQELGIPGESWAAKLMRPVVVYAFLLIGLRLAGRRELAQLNVFDLVVLLTLSNTVQNAIIGNDNSLLGGLAGATVLLATNYAVVRFLYRHPRIDAALEGQPVVLIQDGRVQEEALRRELITPQELLAAVHRQGLNSVDEVATAVLETSGTITVVPREPSPQAMREAAMMARLDELVAEVRALRLALAPAPGRAPATEATGAAAAPAEGAGGPAPQDGQRPGSAPPNG
jgi:uncharacterized membrane protein YcaP (DUF421 family)